MSWQLLNLDRNNPNFTEQSSSKLVGHEKIKGKWKMQVKCTG